ncbi:MAG: response regulator transcription factor [Cyanobacteria bacterium TGS_CYA1]|nr:response regulator transcription factor [Cyanobacteria bacterium TGS_CYA1]
MPTQFNLFCVASPLSNSELKSALASGEFGSITYADDALGVIQDAGRSKRSIFVIQHEKQRRDANEIIAGLRAAIPSGIFVVLLSNENEFWSVISSGANAFLVWPGTSLVSAIDYTIENGYWLDTALTKYLFQGDGQKYLQRRGVSSEIPDAFPTLSAREKEVVDLLVEGLTNKEIAESLNLKLGTVKVHVNHILAKLKLEHRGQAIAKISRLRAMV